MKGKRRYTLEIEPLTAVHIGSGKTLNPLDYMLYDIKLRGGKKRIYMKYNTDKILHKLVETGGVETLTAFNRATEAGNFKALQRFFHDKINGAARDDVLDVFMDYPCDITKGFERLYNSKQEGDPTQNALEVQQMYRPTGKRGAVIPGSSIKGAVRTALLNHILIKEMGDDEYDRLKSMGHNGKREKDIQKAALRIDKCISEKANDAQKDPLRCVSFSDGKIDPRASLVGCLNNVGLGERGALELSDMQIIAETAAGTLAGYGYKALVTAAIDESLQNVKGDEGFAFARKFNMAGIARACNWFFKRQFEADSENHESEYSKFYDGQPDGMELIERLKEIVDSIDESDTSRFLLRVGRWSGVEYVTLGNDFREPDTPIRQGRKMPYGTTRTLLDMDGKRLPMGWCQVKVNEE